MAEGVGNYLICRLQCGGNNTLITFIQVLRYSEGYAQ